MKHILLLITFFVMAGGVSAAPARPEKQPTIRNQGYTLLYDLLDDSSSADKLFVIKHAQPAVVAEIKQIVQLYRDAQQQLEIFRTNDPALNFQAKSLPGVERKTRDAIAASFTKRLLLRSGRAFELEFLESQLRSLDYAGHLAKVIAENEDSKSRQKYLLELTQRCEQHHKAIIDLLAPATP